MDPWTTRLACRVIVGGGRLASERHCRNAEGTRVYAVWVRRAVAGMARVNTGRAVGG